MAEQSQAVKKGSPKKFFKNTIAELKKVVWPTKNQVVKSTTAVVCIIIIVTVILWVFDLLLGSIVSYILH